MSTLGLSLPAAEETTPRPSTPSRFDKTSTSVEGNLSWVRQDGGGSSLLSGEQIRAKLAEEKEILDTVGFINNQSMSNTLQKIAEEKEILEGISVYQANRIL
jgi:hypothetical protein